MKGTIISIFLALLLIAGCSSLTLKPGDFAWPVESVLKIDDQGFIVDEQYHFSLRVKELLYAETQDSINTAGVEVRTIRDGRGYYFMTAVKFKHVYVFEQVESALKLVNKILVAENGLVEPALNQRPPYIELLNSQNPPLRLTKEGLLGGE